MSVSGDLTTIVESGDGSAAMCLQCKTIRVSASSCDDRSSTTSAASVCWPSELVNNKQVSSQAMKIFLPNNLSAHMPFFHFSFNKLIDFCLFVELDRKPFQSRGVFVSGPLTRRAWDVPRKSLSFSLKEHGMYLSVTKSTCSVFKSWSKMAPSSSPKVAGIPA